MPAGVARIPVQNIGVQRGDALGILTHGVRDRLPDQIVQRLGVVHFLGERAGLRLTRRDDRAVQPVLVDRSVKIILEVGAEQRIGAVDEQIELVHRDIFVRREGSRRGAGHDARVKYVLQLGLRPRRHIGEVGGRVTLAGVVALRGGQAAERALEHDERLRAGDRVVFAQIAVRVAVHDIAGGDTGVVVVRRGEQRSADCPARCRGVPVRRERSRQRGEQGGSGQRRREQLFCFHLLHPFFPLLF